MKKKFSLLIALMSLAGLIAIAPLTANAQDDAQAEFERVWYDTCYAKKDVEKCYQQSKELLEKYTKSTYIENAKVKVKVYDQNKPGRNFKRRLTLTTGNLHKTPRNWKRSSPPVTRSSRSSLTGRPRLTSMLSARWPWPDTRPR